MSSTAQCLCSFKSKISSSTKLVWVEKVKNQQLIFQKSIFVSLIITQPGTFIKSKLINSSVSYFLIVDEFNLNLLEKNYASKFNFFFSKHKQRRSQSRSPFCKVLLTPNLPLLKREAWRMEIHCNLSHPFFQEMSYNVHILHLRC